MYIFGISSVIVNILLPLKLNIGKTLPSITFRIIWKICISILLMTVLQFVRLVEGRDTASY